MGIHHLINSLSCCMDIKIVLYITLGLGYYLFRYLQNKSKEAAAALPETTGKNSTTRPAPLKKNTGYETSEPRIKEQELHVYSQDLTNKRDSHYKTEKKEENAPKIAKRNPYSLNDKSSLKRAFVASEILKRKF